MYNVWCINIKLNRNECVLHLSWCDGLADPNPHVTWKLKSHDELFSRWKAYLDEAPKWTFTAFWRLLEHFVRNISWNLVFMGLWKTQWLGSFAWKVIVCTKKFCLFTEGEGWNLLKWGNI